MPQIGSLAIQFSPHNTFYSLTFFDLNFANFSNAELLTTVRLLIAIAPAAYMGLSKPAAAIGIITDVVSKSPEQVSVDFAHCFLAEFNA